MGTGIYQHRMFGSPEVTQENIDYWCSQCKYPTEGKRCKEKCNIQACFDLRNANEWHLIHECPFVHLGGECICNQKVKLDEIKSRSSST